MDFSQIQFFHFTAFYVLFILMGIDFASGLIVAYVKKMYSRVWVEKAS